MTTRTPDQYRDGWRCTCRYGRDTWLDEGQAYCPQCLAMRPEWRETMMDRSHESMVARLAHGPGVGAGVAIDETVEVTA